MLKSQGFLVIVADEDVVWIEGGSEFAGQTPFCARIDDLVLIPIVSLVTDTIYNGFWGLPDRGHATNGRDDLAMTIAGLGDSGVARRGQRVVIVNDRG